MKVHRQDIEAIKRYCEEKGFTYAYNPRDGILEVYARRSYTLTFIEKENDSINVGEFYFFTKVRTYYKRKGKRIDKVLERLR